MEHSLVIHSQGLDIWRHTANGIERESSIDADDKSARAKLQDWLTITRRHTALIADLADERHAVERLPHASRADRLQLIGRKLAQRFPDAAFTSVTPLPAGPEDGLLKPVLLSAIPRSSPISLWLDALSEAAMQGLIDAPLLTSVPFLVEHWYGRQRELPPQCLLLAFGVGGMRQILFRQRRLAFSRVIAARAATLAENLPTYRDELTQTLAWLPSQRLIEGSPPILVLAAQADFPLLRELAPSSNSVMDFIDIARCPGGGADVLTLALRETRQPGTPDHYDCHALRRARRFSAARRATWIAAAAVLAIGLVAGTAEFIDTHHLHEETRQLVAERQKLQNELERLTAEAITAPGADFPDDWLDKAENLMRDPGIAPIDILQAVAGLLNKAPWARLESLVWKKQVARDGSEGDSSDKGAPQNAQPGSAENAPGDTPAVSIELEVSINGNEAPQVAADRLVSLWQRQHGSPMMAHIDHDMAHLRLDTTLDLTTKREKAP